MSGKLLVLEGTDGAGKATQVKLLREHFEKQGRKVFCLSYPDYNSVYGKIIDSFLHFQLNLGAEEQFFLYLLDMIKDKDRITKELETCDIVILDRYLFSTLAYQCSNGFDLERAKSLIRLMGLNKPFAVFYVDVPVEISMERKQKQKSLTGDVDKFEKDKMLLKNVKSVYEKLLKEGFFADNWARVDGALDQNSVSRQIISATERLSGSV